MTTYTLNFILYKHTETEHLKIITVHTSLHISILNVTMFLFQILSITLSYQHKFQTNGREFMTLTAF
jgi:hypothetical protein